MRVGPLLQVKSTPTTKEEAKTDAPGGDKKSAAKRSSTSKPTAGTSSGISRKA